MVAPFRMFRCHPVLLALGLSVLATTVACSAGSIETPGIWVIVDSEGALASELDRIEVQTDRNAVTVWLKNAPAGSRKRSLPVRVDIVADESRLQDVLRVTGYAGSTRRVERVAALTFDRGKRSVLRVLLTDTCADLLDECRADEGLTCVNCRGVCESVQVPASDLQQVDLGIDPLTSYVPEQCAMRDAGMGLDGSLKAGGDASLDSGPSTVPEASLDGSVQRLADASHDAGLPDVASDGSTSSTDASYDGGPALDSGYDSGTNASFDAGSPGSLRDECVLLFHMEEPSFSGTTFEVSDDSGFDNDGTPTLSGATTVSEGRFGRTAKFDGSGWVHVGDAPSLRASSALTVSAWFYLEQLPTNFPGIVAKRNGHGDGVAFTLFLSPDDAQTTESEVHLHADIAGDESRVDSKATISPGVWHHAVLVFDGTRPQSERIELYIDGTLDSTAEEPSTSIPPYTSDVLIGNLVNGGSPFVGSIDEVAIWRRALSTPEIATLAISAP